MSHAKIGLIARADNGGLGNLTWEFALHMRPAKILIKNLDAEDTQNRGGYFPDRYSGDAAAECRVSTGYETSDEEFEWLCDGVDVVYTAEVDYGVNLWKIAAAAKTATILHAMPELFRATTNAAHVWVPTNWEMHRVKKAGVVPVPVNLDRFQAHRDRPANEVPIFYHTTAPAMADRNGTIDLIAALPHIKVECKIIFAGKMPREVPARVGAVTTEVIDQPVDVYWDAHPIEADVLVLPRRYAGLSMPMQEAMAGRRLVVAPNISPQDKWPGIAHVKKVSVLQRMRMSGGTFNVYKTDPRALADTLTLLASGSVAADGRPVTEALSDRALQRAKDLSWGVWTDRYRQLFDTYAEQAR